MSELTAWHELFVASAGAAAALAGLIIVAMSVNIQLIIKYPGLISRAGATIASTVLALYVSIVGLVPDQALAWLGAEIVFGSVVLLVISSASAVSLFRARGEASVLDTAAKAALTLVPAVLVAIGGIVLCTGSIVGLGAVVAGMLAAFVFSIVNTWVLMVEILR